MLIGFRLLFVTVAEETTLNVYASPSCKSRLVLFLREIRI